MIVVATIIADRKAASQLIGIPAASQFEGVPIKQYINIQTELDIYIAMNGLYKPLFDYMNASGKDWDYDIWSWPVSSWKLQPEYDQDQKRLDYIVHARNMCRSYFLNQKDATHLAFIDSDVRPRSNGLQRLLDLNTDVCGGLVPGRGVHNYVHYIFGEQRPIPNKPGVLECAHGTCGYMLIKRRLLETLAFRYGRSRVNPIARLSEDPAFCSDAVLNGFQPFLLDTNAVAEHWDDPEHPLTISGVSHDEEIP